VRAQVIGMYTITVQVFCTVVLPKYVMGVLSPVQAAVHTYLGKTLCYEDLLLAAVSHPEAMAVKLVHHKGK